MVSKLGYHITRPKPSDKRDSGNYCFGCKEVKDDYFELSDISYFWKGICTECAKDPSKLENYYKTYENFIKYQYEFYIKFKYKWLKEKRKYMDRLKFLLSKTNMSTSHKKKVRNHFSLGVRKGFIYTYCTECFVYDEFCEDSDNFRGRSSNSLFRKGGVQRLCRKHANVKARNTSDPSKNKLYRKAYESKVKYSYELDANLPRKKIRRIENSLRNIKLTKKERAKLVQYYRVADKLSKRYGVTFHVDHIIPLRGDSIIGLNHPDNLQILRYDVNIRKCNNIIFKEGLSFDELRDLNSLDIWGNYKNNIKEEK